MKRFNTDDLHIKIRTVRQPNHQSVLLIQYGRDIDSEHEIILPAEVVKKNINDSGFTKHILNYFVKD